ncbi:UBP-type zinc finger domain-containing protein [Modestobacter marinus]|uniref:UBP-type zinc finger domain-containing protein n=1 Tax=Modestobacter marinus TaxID=477641 RepID=UPI001C93836B|nr:UBP-type zinc finger domain-containing protein [Modestobacter marinus]
MTSWQVQDGDVCGHTGSLVVEPRPGDVCEDCVRTGGRWVHLRRCLVCDHVGCCDSSPNRHATAHWQATEHPVVASAEPTEHWAWCYPDQAVLLPAAGEQ